MTESERLARAIMTPKECGVLITARDKSVLKMTLTLNMVNHWPPKYICLNGMLLECTGMGYIVYFYHEVVDFQFIQPSDCKAGYPNQEKSND